MSGIAVVGELLMTYAPLTAVVPADRIKAGILPYGAKLPAIGAMTISGNDRNILKAGAKRRRVQRIQVTVLASNYQQQTDVLKLARAACADRIGDFGGVTEVVVLTDSEGPDMMDDNASIYLQSQDFMVSFNEAT